MPEIVRLVSDGEELVLSQGEAFRVLSKTGAPTAAAVRATESSPPVRVAIQYQGFLDAGGRREYALEAQRGDRRRRYIVWIDQAAFAERRALLQDGPDICYQKLLRELDTSQLEGDACLGVTDDDLTAYRDAHARPARKGFSHLAATKPTTPEAPESD
jgi:hypothetical protein